jgi:hypothetical protein
VTTSFSTPGLLDEVEDLSWDIAKSQPTTLAVLQYTAADPDGERWPVMDDEEDWTKTNEWRSLLHANLAEALERIARA